MLAFITANLLWTEGIVLVGLFISVGVISLFLFRPLFYVTVLLFVFSLYFFRNPDRICSQVLYDDTVIVCPADGSVIDIQHNRNGHLEGYAQKVSIFLSPIDVHVNWIPVAGNVEAVTYQPGSFMPAFFSKSSEYNEHNDVIIKNNYGTLLVRQIAGILARRISCWAKKGQQVMAGQKYGMIKFGSRVDILLPAYVTLNIRKGQKVYGGQTVLGTWIKK